MLFYIKCPSCSRLISADLDKYSTDLIEIRDDPVSKKNEKEKMAANLLDKYGIRQICCRIRIMGLVPYHEIINT